MASLVTDIDDGKPSDTSIDSGYEEATVESPTGALENLTSEPATSTTEQEGDHPTEGHTSSGVREKEGYVALLEQRLEQVENELKGLRSGE